MNNIRGVLKTCAVKAPGFGYRRKAMLEDIAILDWRARRSPRKPACSSEKVTLKDLGQASASRSARKKPPSSTARRRKSDRRARQEHPRPDRHYATSDYDK